MPEVNKSGTDDLFEEKLFFRECESLSSNCIYQIHKVSEECESLVREGLIFLDNFCYYKRELNFKAALNAGETAKSKQKWLYSANTSLMLSEFAFKLELFLERLDSAEKKGLAPFKEVQSAFFDTFNLDSLIQLLKTLEVLFVNPEFIRMSKNSHKGHISKLDRKIHQVLDPTNPLVEQYTSLSRLIYTSLRKLSLNNHKTSTRIIEVMDVFSGQLRTFNGEIRKLLGTAIPCAMPFDSSEVDHVADWFNFLAPLAKTQNNSNITEQLIALKVLRGLCLGSNGKGDLTNQRICLRLLQSSGSVGIGFGVEESRPHITFSKSDPNFLNNNPILASYSRTLDYEKNAKLFCVNLDDLSRNQKSTVDYILYVGYVLQLFAAMCAGRFNAGVAELAARGLGGYHVITCLRMGSSALHPKLVRAYLQLAKVLCIDVDPLTSLAVLPSRCYL